MSISQLPIASRSIQIVGWLIAGTLIALTVLAVHRTFALFIDTRTSLLQADEWDLLRRYIDMTAGRIGSLTFLFEPHNEHRVFLSRLVFLTDIHLNGQQNIAQMLTFAFSILLAAMFSLLVVCDRAVPAAVKIGVTALIVALFLSVRQIENFYRGFNHCIPMSMFFTAAAPIALARGWTKSAISSGLLASLSTASGMVVWPALALTAFGMRRWRLGSVVCLIGVIGMLAYSGNTKSIGLATLIEKLPEIFTYALLMISNPFGLSPKVGVAVSLVALAIIVWQALRSLLTRDTFALALVSICFAVLAISLMVAIGRVDLGMKYAMSSRYVTLMNPFWAALLVILVRAAVRPPISISHIALAAMIAAFVSLSYAEPPWARPWAHNQRVIFTRTSHAIETGNLDPALLRDAYPDPKRIIDLAPQLRALEMSPFATH